MIWFHLGLISLLFSVLQLLWWRRVRFRGTGWLLPFLIPSVREAEPQAATALLEAAELKLVGGASGWLLSLPLGFLVLALSVIAKLAAEGRLNLGLTTAILVAAYFAIRGVLQVGLTLLLRRPIDRFVAMRHGDLRHFGSPPP